MNDEEILSCVAEALGVPLPVSGGSITPLSGKQGLLVCRVSIPGAPACVFKAVRQTCRNELRLSAWLAKVVPYAVPAVLHACEDDCRSYYWAIMQDEGDTRLSDRPTATGYIRAASTLARLQIDMLGALAELSDLGVRTMDRAGWEEMALSLLGALEDGQLAFVSDRKALVEGLWRAGEMAEDAAVLPLSLVHGDLHAGNIVEQPDGEVRLLDWGSAYVGAAFLGLAELLWPAERFARKIGGLGPVRKAYLDIWAPIVGKPGRLANAISACEALARLSLIQEALRHPDRFGDFGAATMAAHFLEHCRQWERARAC